MDDDKKMNDINQQFLLNKTILTYKDTLPSGFDLSTLYSSSQIDIVSVYAAAHSLSPAEVAKAYFENYDSMVEWHSTINWDGIKTEIYNFINSHPKKSLLKKINSRKQNQDHARDLGEIFNSFFGLFGKNEFVAGESVGFSRESPGAQLVRKQYFSKTHSYANGGTANTKTGERVVFLDSVEFQAEILEYILMNNPPGTHPFKKKAAEIYGRVGKQNYIDSIVLFNSFHENAHVKFENDPDSVSFPAFEGVSGKINYYLFILQPLLRESMADYLAMRDVERLNGRSGIIKESLKAFNYLQIHDDFETLEPNTDTSDEFILIPSLYAERPSGKMRIEMQKVFYALTKDSHQKSLKNYRKKRKEEILNLL